MFGKRVDLISRNVGDLDKTKKASSYIGKIVYSKKGEVIGRIYDVILKKGVLMGVLVRGKRKTFIGKEFFASESKEALMLKIEPVTSIIGRQVFDSLGKRIGKVSGLKRKSNTNTYNGIFVKKSIYRKAFEISKKDIDVAKKTVLLKKPHEKAVASAQAAARKTRTKVKKKKSKKTSKTSSKSRTRARKKK